MVKYACLLVAAGLFMISCASSRTGRAPEKNNSSGEVSGFQENFDPLSLNDDDIEIQAVRKTDTQGNDETIVPASAEPNELPKKLVSGYRVQILATKDENMAREKKRKAMLVFSEKVYLEFEAPYYKLRLGDFADRKEAEAFREHVSRKGIHEKETEWRNAWIVPAKVMVSAGGE